MGDEHRVKVVRSAADIARARRLPGAVVLVDVERLLARELVLERRRHRLIGPVHIREQSVAAGRWQLETVEERISVRPRRIAAVDVEPEFALAERPDRLAVDLDVGDEENFLIVLLNSFGAVAERLWRSLAITQNAEIGRETKLVVLGQRLSPEHQHEVLGPGVLDCSDHLIGERPGEIDTLDFRPAGSGQRSDLDVDDVLHWGNPPLLRGSTGCRRLEGCDITSNSK